MTNSPSLYLVASRNSGNMIIWNGSSFWMTGSATALGTLVNSTSS